jgi:hypothetical protein
MNKNLKGVVAVVLVGALVYGVYLRVYGNKHRFATIILKLGKAKGTMAKLHSFDVEFLEAWAKASKKDLPTFSFNDKIYNTQGGTAKQ